ncbi:MAG: hypothetical protein ABSF62_04630 [Bryobacteraceae bacterium]
MSYQWLHVRITEESERRKREASTLEKLPQALEEVRGAMAACVEAYTRTFGPETAELQASGQRLWMIVREEQNGRWEQRSKVDVTVAPALPGFRIERGGEPLEIVVGILPGDKLFYRDGDQYLTMEELTRRILDKALFPKLGE